MSWVELTPRKAEVFGLTPHRGQALKFTPHGAEVHK